ncbi:hypothetical protein MMPV_004000 [Pyropia vietnamensis]
MANRCRRVALAAVATVTAIAVGTAAATAAPTAAPTTTASTVCGGGATPLPAVRVAANPPPPTAGAAIAASRTQTAASLAAAGWTAAAAKVTASAAAAASAAAGVWAPPTTGSTPWSVRLDSRGDTNPYYDALLRRLGGLRARVAPSGDGGIALPWRRADKDEQASDEVPPLDVPDLDVRTLRGAAAAARDWALVAANPDAGEAVPGLPRGEAFGRAVAAVDAHTFALVTLGRDALSAAAAAAATGGDQEEEEEVVAAVAASASTAIGSASASASVSGVSGVSASATTAAADLALTGRVYDDFFALADTLAAGAVLVTSFPRAFIGAGAPLATSASQWAAAGATAWEAWRSTVGGDNYVNRDLGLAVTFHAAAMLLASAGQSAEAAAAAADAAALVREVAAARMEGGGWPYIGTSHEVPVYHAINVRFLASYWMLMGTCRDGNGGKTGAVLSCVDARAEIAASAAWYPSALTTVTGVPEWASAPSWKSQWPNAGRDAWNAHTVGLATLATIRDSRQGGGDGRGRLPAGATITAAGCNLALSPRSDVRLGTWVDTLLRATVSAADIAAATAACPALPDGQTLADAGLGGPRGRYGRVMTVLAGRDVTADGARRPGPQTYAGAVVAAAPPATFPLEAALLAAYPMLWTVPVAVAAATWRTPAAHVAPPPPAPAVRVVVGGAVGCLAAVHGLGRVTTGPIGRPAAPGWGAHQLWVSLPDRLVGVMSVEVVDSNGAAAYGVGVRLRVGAGVLSSSAVADGRAPDTTLRSLSGSGVAGRAWRFGQSPLTVRVVDTNLPDVRVLTGVGIQRDRHAVAAEVALSDDRLATLLTNPGVRPQGESPPVYPRRTAYYAVVEVGLTAAAAETPATAVTYTPAAPASPGGNDDNNDDNGGGVSGVASLRVVVPTASGSGSGNRSFTLLSSVPARGGREDGGPPPPAVDVPVEADGDPRRRVSLLTAAAPGATAAAITSTLYAVEARGEAVHVTLPHVGATLLVDSPVEADHERSVGGGEDALAALAKSMASLQAAP